MRHKIYNCGCIHPRKHLRLFTTVISKGYVPRLLSSYTKESQMEKQTTDPFQLTKHHLDFLHDDIQKILTTDINDLQQSSQYYFDKQGKLFRPMTVLLMGQACNSHLEGDSTLRLAQKRIAMIAEMIHTSSLLHDDVIDDAITRRNKLSVNQRFTQKEAILAGDFILSKASILLAQLRNTQAVSNFAQIIDDLVKGELMQLVPRSNIEERFNHYLTKTFRKTASLIAYSCKSVALLGDAPENVQNAAFSYGKNLGMVFQLIDDALDFTSTSEAMGKETNADLSLGLATAPVLFATQKFPDLHALIGRRFKEKGDVEKAIDFVSQSDGIRETYLLANNYANHAIKDVSILNDSQEKKALINLCQYVVNRTR